MIFLVYCIVLLFYAVSCFVPQPYVMYFLLMARYSLFVLKVPLNTKKPKLRMDWSNNNLFLSVLTDIFQVDLV